MKDAPYIGELKERIAIVKDVKATSATGAPTETRENVKNCWAKMVEKSASEEDEGKVRFLYTTEFYVRYDKQLLSGVAQDFKIIDEDNNLYEVLAVVNKIPKRYLQINTIRRG